MYAMSYIKELFRRDGILERDHGKPSREGQLQIALAIEQCFQEGLKGLLEGPTGTGKTYAYGAVAIDYAAGSDHGRTVIGAKDNALVKQICQDLVDLAEIMGSDVKIAWLKGRKHYLCTLRTTGIRDGLLEHTDALPKTHKDLTLSQTQYLLQKQKIRTPTQVDQLLNIFKFEDDGGGDLGEHTEFPDKNIRKLVTISPSECQNERTATETKPPCVHSSNCPFYEAQNIAKEADIVITNFHLLMFNFRLAYKIFGDFYHVILDEAHEFNEAVKEVYSEQRSSKFCEDFVTSVNTVISKILREYGDESEMDELKHFRENHLDALRASVKETQAEMLQFWGQMQRHVMENSEYRNVSKKNQLPKEHETILPQFHTFSIESLIQSASRTRSLSILGILSLPIGTKEKARMMTSVNIDGELKQLDGWLKFKDPSLVCSVKVSEHDRVYLRTAPYDVSTVIRNEVFQHLVPTGKVDGITTYTKVPDRTVVAISATLDTDGTWRYPRAQLAMDETVMVCKVDSPYDFPSQARWFTPTQMPHPNREKLAYIERASRELRALVQCVGGRTLVLCSKRADLAHAVKAIAGLGYTVLKQDDYSPAEIRRRFLEDETSCLVACKTFGTGFDIQGRALQCVVVWKLPFPPPTPHGQRYGEIKWRGNYPIEYYNPLMLMSLKQWAGRLIRARDDIGIIAILDERAVKSSRAGRNPDGYLEAVTDAMPAGIPRVSTLADVAEFLETVRAQRFDADTGLFLSIQ